MFDIFIVVTFVEVLTV